MDAAHGPLHRYTNFLAKKLRSVLDAKGGCEAEVAALIDAHGK